MDRHRLGLAAVATVPATFLAVFFVLPVVSVLARGASLDGVADVLGDERLRRVLWFTLWQAAVSTALTVAIGVPVAWVLARHRFLGRSLVWALVGWFVLRAATQHDPSEPVGFDASLRELAAEPWGEWVLLAAFLGFAAYGLLCLTTARWFDPPDGTEGG